MRDLNFITCRVLRLRHGLQRLGESPDQIGLRSERLEGECVSAPYGLFVYGELYTPPRKRIPSRVVRFQVHRERDARTIHTGPRLR